MTPLQPAAERAIFEELVARSRTHPETMDALRELLARQTRFERDPDPAGLDELAEVLAGGGEGIDALERGFEGRPLVHLYGFALHREAGDLERARSSLAALLAADPDDPMAAYFDADLHGRAVAPASEEQRVANIAKLASTPLLSDPYRLAVHEMFAAIREHEHARVLDVGVGSGAQMAALLDLLASEKHRVKRLVIVGLDFVPDFLAAAARRIADAASELAGRTKVAYEPVTGRVEALAEPDFAAIASGGLDAANATIALHEVPGEAKLAALRALRRLAPARLVIAEWNYCLENVLAETSTEFVFNVRSVAAEMISALRKRYTVDESRAVVRDWLSQGTGQLTCPADRRQECFLEVQTWHALLEHSGFDIIDTRAENEPIALLVAGSSSRAGSNHVTPTSA